MAMQLKFYSAWFCPYAQRAWLTLNYHNIPFEYVESLAVNSNQEEGHNGYTKHPDLLKLNPKGLVPTIVVEGGTDLVGSIPEDAKRTLTRSTDDTSWIVTNSLDCMVFLNQVAKRLNGGDAFTDLGSDLSNANLFNQDISSTFYKILMKPTLEERKEAYAVFATNIGKYLQSIIEDGFYNSKDKPTLVDLAIIPWLLRIPLLEHYRPMFQLNDHLEDGQVRKLEDYIRRMRKLDAVQKTLWKEQEDLIRAYKRYADGTATSQVGKAVASGRNVHDV